MSPERFENLIARIAVGATTPRLTRNKPGPVRMDKATQQRFGVGMSDRALPRCELDIPEMLPAGAMLGEQSGPMLRIRRDHHAE